LLHGCLLSLSGAGVYNVEQFVGIFSLKLAARAELCSAWTGETPVPTRAHWLI
jgi:hypothetical protein